MTAPAVSGDVVVNYRAKGVELVQSSFRRVAGEGAAALEKTGRATQRIASGLTEVARSGELAGRGFNEILKSVSEIAFAFGPAGLFVGAVGIAGTAIIDKILEPMREAKKEAQDFAKALEDAGHAGSSIAARERADRLRFGDPFAQPGSIAGESNVAFALRSQGYEGLQALRAQLAAVPMPRTTPGGVLAGRGGRQFDAFNAAQAQIREIDRLLGPAVQQYDRMDALADGLAVSEERRKAAAEATADALKAQADATKLAADQAKRWGESYNRVFNSGTAGVTTIQDFSKVPLSPNAGFSSAVSAALGSGPKVAPIPVDPFMERIRELGSTIQQGIATTIGDAVVAGFDAAFSGRGLGGAISALGGTALKGLGALFKQVGAQSLIGLKFIETIKNAIISLNPLAGVAAATGLIALGSALQAGGNALGGSSRGANYGYSSAGYSAPSAPIVVGAGAMPSLAGVSPKQAVTVNATIIGPNDPQAGRQLLDLITTARRRVS